MKSVARFGFMAGSEPAVRPPFGFRSAGKDSTPTVEVCPLGANERAAACVPHGFAMNFHENGTESLANSADLPQIRPQYRTHTHWNLKFIK